MREIEKSYELIYDNRRFMLGQKALGFYYISKYRYTNLMTLIKEYHQHWFWVDISKDIYDAYKLQDSIVYHITQTELDDLANFRPELFI